MKDHSKNIIYRMGYLKVKDLSYTAIDSANPLYLIISEPNGYIKSNESKYLFNIRSLQKNFYKLIDFLDTLDFEFKVICISETWCSENVSCNSLCKIPNYNSIHQTRGNGKAGGWVAMFIHNTLIYNMKLDLSIINDNIEAVCIEIVNNNGKNILVNTQYRQPAGIFSEFEKYLKDFTNKVKNNGKDLYIVGDMNLNLLDHSTNSKVKEYLNVVFQIC